MTWSVFLEKRPIDRFSSLSDALWTGGQIEPAWGNYYESQCYKSTAICQCKEFKELCVLTSFKPTEVPPSSLSPPPSWCCLKSPLPQDCVGAPGWWPEPTMTNWGNTSKNCASIPQDTAKHNRQELVAFCQLQCQECWYFTYFNHNSSTGADDQNQN